MEKQSTFLDKQTFFALIVILLAWFGWERYMRKKYPPQTPPKQVQEAQEVQEAQDKEISKSISYEKPQINKPKEKILSFEDENWRITLSSYGLGVKDVLLKKFSDEEKKPIQFISENGKLFFQTRASGEDLFFSLKKVGKNKVEGSAWYKNRQIKARVTVHKYYVEYELDLNPKEVSSVTIATSVFPKEKAQGFFKSLLSGGRRGLSFFAKDFNESHQIIYSDQDENNLNLKQVNVLGLGGKYFGQAFSNHSEIIPSLDFKGAPQKWEARAQYQFSPNIVTSTIKYKTFFGPKLSYELDQVHPELSNWIDLGFLRSLATSILWFLRKAYSFTKNWGIAIILLTLFVRILLFPLNKFMYKAMKVMKEIQPEMKAIREKHKKDPKTMQLEILALMRKNNAKPFSMYLPMIIQIPIFIALYRVLGESFELYQAPFFGWIQDLSSKDPFYILPVLMGIAMFFQQKLSPTTSLEPAQEKILRILPIIFTILLINLPSGLILYILVSTLFGLAQQYYFIKKH